jgi:hypothetical protein
MSMSISIGNEGDRETFRGLVKVGTGGSKGGEYIRLGEVRAGIVVDVSASSGSGVKVFPVTGTWGAGDVVSIASAVSPIARVDAEVAPSLGTSDDILLT